LCIEEASFTVTLKHETLRLSVNLLITQRQKMII
jgi:hypothetical protein